MSGNSSQRVVIVGGGPAGSVAALCLRKLGREATILEKLKFPRYRIGESLLPGTMSILTRLGVFDKIDEAKFVKKRAATFVWGGGRAPWSFTFSTPKTAPWVFDHALQVQRAEFDHILLKAAAERGTDVRELHEVTGIELDANGPASVGWRNDSEQGEMKADFVIDASGARGIIAQKLNLRQWDKYYRNMAVWSYFRGGKRFTGDLEGNIFSVAFQEGWIWIIPLKDDLYSVGVVTAIENNERIRAVGPHAFYHECLKMCPLAMEILGTATQCDDMRVLREWAYEAKMLSTGRAFLCGDSGCFIDPLFSQGVHLATYSGMMAAAAIDHLYDHPEDADEVHAWYDRSYREAYLRYHKFVAAFYACNDTKDSKFWSSRKIEGALDQRFDGKEWFTALSGQNVEAGAAGVDEVREGAATLATLWEHGTQDISDEYDGSELATRRVLWANELFKQFQSMTAVRWKPREARLYTSYKVHPTSFKLERQQFLGDESGRAMKAHALTEEHRKLFAGMIDQPLSYKDLTAHLKKLGGQGTPVQIAGRLFEEHFLEGRDRNGEVVRIRSALRFGGVGAEDDIS